MAEINLEKIRQEALEEFTQGIEKGPYGDMVRLYADISSKITKRMMENYQQQLFENR